MSGSIGKLRRAVVNAFRAGGVIYPNMRCTSNQRAMVFAEAFARSRPSRGDCPTEVASQAVGPKPSARLTQGLARGC